MVSPEERSYIEELANKLDSVYAGAGKHLHESLIDMHNGICVTLRQEFHQAAAEKDVFRFFTIWCAIRDSEQYFTLDRYDQEYIKGFMSALLGEINI